MYNKFYNSTHDIYFINIFPLRNKSQFRCVCTVTSAQVEFCGIRIKNQLYSPENNYLTIFVLLKTGFTGQFPSSILVVLLSASSVRARQAIFPGEECATSKTW